MISIKSIMCGAMLLVTLATAAQNNKLLVSGELRPRILLDNGYKTPAPKGESTPVYTTQRTRVNLLFRNDKFDTYISFQDVRLWGNDNNSNRSGVYGNTESLSIHQAWVKLNLTKSLSLKTGRQSFSYDDQRILSARNWNDYQVTYDALLAEYKTDKHRFHLGLSYNAENKTNLLYPTAQFKTLDFLHYQYQKDKLTLSAIGVLTGNTHTDTTKQVYYRGTYGFNGNYSTSTTSFRLSTYYQHNFNKIGGNVSAFCISAYAEQALNNKLSLGAGIDYLSGNDEASTSSTNNRFDILYGRRHSWYGYMDYFSTTPDQGLQDLMTKLTYKPTGNIDIQMHGHYFKLAADKYDRSNPNQKLKNNLGQELDFIMKWKFYSMAVLELGYSFYNTTTTLEKLKNVYGKSLKTPQFCYIMLTIKPSL